MLESATGVAEHIYSCDPVRQSHRPERSRVVQQDHAYVTLFAETSCSMGENQLKVYDVSDPDQPEEVYATKLDGPRGLGVDGRLLFVTDGRSIKVFDITNPAQPAHVHRLDGVDGYDVIPHEGVLIVSAEDGLHQYRYDADRVEMIGSLSHIPIGKPFGPARLEIATDSEPPVPTWKTDERPSVDVFPADEPADASPADAEQTDTPADQPVIVEEPGGSESF